MKKYLSVKEAAEYMGCGLQNIYKALNRKKLKFVKMDVPHQPGHRAQHIFTTAEWLEEWKAIMHDKNTMRWNGRPMFKPENGMYSASQAQEILGWSKNKLAYYRIKGDIKCARKGYYYIYDALDVEALRQKVETKALLLKTG
jgi:hypothetical protein